MSRNQHQGLAIVTGGSRGIGAEYAQRLADRGYPLLLVGRDKDQLHQVRERLIRDYHVEVIAECLDLSVAGASHQLFALAQQHKTHIDMLVNNAGFGMYGAFTDMPMSRIREMLQLHINTVVESTRLFLPAMIERRSGAIINVASVAGFLPIPFMAEYAATKAFLISFSEALAEEVREAGITIQTCCPGSTDTNFHNTAGHRPANPLGSQTVQDVVQASLTGLDKHHSRITVGWQGWLSDRFSRFLPRTMMIRMAGNQVKPRTRD
ncbi:MAG: short-chain dehydrogenase [Nitrospirales bacterium]|nr:MAG: short-chain dehydrogenase [Nitrospirales bacterium]